MLKIEIFIKANALVKRRGLPEYYNEANTVRLVQIGDRWRMDVKHAHNWSAFKSSWVVGHCTREFGVRKPAPEPVKWPRKKLPPYSDARGWQSNNLIKKRG